ncbi:PTS transporter subunit EIIC [Paenibacillus sp. ACRRX]|uniref:PTS transporter subunit EIIC n=1 Tax=unclassified Paenibacillus TaxID=185978 RepID=UPI001EF4738D|nr:MULTISPECIES: PTS transporter subunit EIIC [unclassified Paenibacillus]MCG7408450.1 PTS transporter subunit EIIC [Paenibacillus sp. ACRRX]MDK8182688.1 PTS transporter subunit EIIC [Paenibacillus sp. UMB4589-SE434]
MLAFLQKIGRALMLPVATLPAAAILLRFGAIDYVKDFHMGAAGEFLNQYVAPFLFAGGDTIFKQLPLIFAVAIAIGLAGDAVAALAAVLAHIILMKILEITPGIFSFIPDDLKLDMGVLGGILAGCLAAFMYNRYHNIKMPDWLGFFGGKRFVPMVTSVSIIIIGLAFAIVWGPVQQAIDSFGNWVVGLGAIGSGGFMVANRLLIPTGLHHILNNIAWFQLGTFTDAAGEVVKGDITRFFAGDKSAGMFMTGFFPIMMFALPGAALAIIHTARPEKRKAVASIFMGVAFASFLTGVTEPIEFAFMFAAPVLFVVHAVLAGASGVITALLGIKHGFGFSAGFIDYALNFPLATKPLWLIPIGIAYFVVYYFLFRFLIVKLNLKTPGREVETEESNAATAGAANSTLKEKAVKVLENIGGKDNIITNEACITRLRLTLKDDSLVNESGLKALGAAGIMRLGKGNVQVVFGTQSELLKEEIKKL